MAVTTFPYIEKLGSLIDLQIHQIARKNFHYHSVGEFPYNLLIYILDNPQNTNNYFTNCETGQSIHLQTGHAYILPCHVPIRYERTPDVTGITMRFNLTIFYGLDIFNGCKDIRDVPAHGLASILRKTVCRNDLSEEQQLKATFILKTELSKICLSCWPEQEKNFSLRIRKYEKVFRYIREQGGVGLSVAEMAKICGMRQDVFSRSFTRDTGISPKRYISDFLVRKISTMLLNTDMTLREIAGELEFNSEYYLSRFFKKQTKLSPREYKNHFRY